MTQTVLVLSVRICINKYLYKQIPTNAFKQYTQRCQCLFYVELLYVRVNVLHFFRIQ